MEVMTILLSWYTNFNGENALKRPWLFWAPEACFLHIVKQYKQGIV